jgi:hypothetical protein
MDADQVGMQACWYGNDYGDADYKHSPLPNQGNSTTNNTTGSGTDVGMHLWYASDASTFQQLGWRNGDSNWTYQQEWQDKNGHAGVGCYSWGPGTTTYVMMVSRGLVERHQHQYFVLFQPSDQSMDKQLSGHQQRTSIHELRLHERVLCSGTRWLDHRIQHRLGI